MESLLLSQQQVHQTFHPYDLCFKTSLLIQISLFVLDDKILGGVSAGSKSNRVKLFHTNTHRWLRPFLYSLPLAFKQNLRIKRTAKRETIVLPLFTLCNSHLYFLIMILYLVRLGFCVHHLYATISFSCEEHSVLLSLSQQGKQGALSNHIHLQWCHCFTLEGALLSFIHMHLNIFPSALTHV